MLLHFQVAGIMSMVTLFLSIPREMVTVCLIITDWILAFHGKAKKQTGLNVTGIFQCIMSMDARMPMLLIFNRTRMIRIKCRLFSYRFSGLCLPLLTISNFKIIQNE